VPTLEQLHAWGYHLVPFTKRRTVSDESRPAIKGYFGTDSQDRVKTMFKDAHDWAIVPTTTCVLDLEMKKGLDGRSDLERICNEHGTTAKSATAGCPITATKSGGWHIWYRQPSARQLTGGLHVAGGVECKAINGTVHIPPSLGYREVHPLRQPDDLPAMPGFLVDLWESRSKHKQSNKEYKYLTVPVGERRAFMLSMAGKLRNELAFLPEELYAVLTAMRDTRLEDPASVSDEEIALIAKDIGAREPEAILARSLMKDPVALSVLRMACGVNRAG